MRYLTDDEVRAVRVTNEARDEAAAIQRLFCEVNGIQAPGAAPTQSFTAIFDSNGGMVLKPLCRHERTTQTIGPTTDQINHYCRDCCASWTTFPHRGEG